MRDGFYRAFEDKHRGSRELIESRLRVYLPFITPLRDLIKPASAIDLGCGRGEWLELLTENGFTAEGVDLDEGMLEACHEQGLKAHHREALDFMRELPDASHAIVSGFHIAEHIPFSDLQVLVSEARRILRPGGLLILETPNPENLQVGTSGFYVDPTHNRPIPPQLLEFIPQYTGFLRTKVLRLQESEILLGNHALTLMNVLGGVSPDYAVVAQKKGPKSLINAVDSAFSSDYGVTLHTLADRYQEQVEARAGEQEGRAVIAEARAQAQEERAVAAEARAGEQEGRAVIVEARAQAQEERAVAAEARAGEQEGRAVIAEARAQAQEERAVAAEARAGEQEVRAVVAEAHAVAAEVRTQALESALDHQQMALADTKKQLDAINRQALDWHDQILRLQRTFSWRITGPIRLGKRGIIVVCRGIKWFIHRLLIVIITILCLPFFPLMLLAIPFVLARPSLRDKLGRRIADYPRLRSSLRNIAFKFGFISHDPRLDKYIDSNNPRLNQPLDAISQQSICSDIQESLRKPKPVYRHPPLGKLSAQIFKFLDSRKK